MTSVNKVEFLEANQERITCVQHQLAPEKKIETCITVEKRILAFLCCPHYELSHAASITHDKFLSGMATAGMECSVELLPVNHDGRSGTFTIGDDRFQASLLDLPCVLESYKTYDDNVLIKTADIGQIIMVQEEGDLVPEGPEYRHGLTPAMRDARRRRFRREPDINPDLVQQVENDLQSIMAGGTARDVDVEVVEQEEDANDDAEAEAEEPAPRTTAPSKKAKGKGAAAAAAAATPAPSPAPDEALGDGDDDFDDLMDEEDEED